ncbi:MAG: SDR family oxidoreductase [Bacillota bacterium]|nr:SDR family oxidoreductase [Bacillota bacterium]
MDRPGSDYGDLGTALAQQWGVAVDVFECDLELEASGQTLVRWTAERERGLDILVNNAAFVGTTNLEGWVIDLQHQTLDTWRRAVEVNLIAAFNLSKGLSPLLSAGKGVAIINIASIYGSFAPDYGLYAGTSMGNPAAYAASKGGLIQLTRWLATTLAPRIRVNAISPGGIARDQPPAFVQRYSARTPPGRMATADDMKGAVAYLASDMSRHVTGQNLAVDGGWGVW